MEVSFTNQQGNNYELNLSNNEGEVLYTNNGTLASTEISTISFKYILSDASAAMLTALDAYIILDNVVFSSCSIQK